MVSIAYGSSDAGHRSPGPEIGRNLLRASYLPEDGETTEKLLQKAEQTMTLAKSRSRNRYQFYIASVDSEMRRRRELEKDLRDALQLLQRAQRLVQRHGAVAAFHMALDGQSHLDQAALDAGSYPQHPITLGQRRHQAQPAVTNRHGVPARWPRVCAG